MANSKFTVMLWFMVGCCHWLLTLFFYHIQETDCVSWSELTEPSLTFVLSKKAEFLLWCKDFCLFFFQTGRMKLSVHTTY